MPDDLLRLSTDELVEALGSEYPKSPRHAAIKAALEIRMAQEADKRTSKEAAKATRLAWAALAVSLAGVAVQAIGSL